MKQKYEINGTWYHGGKLSSIEEIAENKIDTSLGGGELGVGFYIGNYGHEASAWARHVVADGKPAVAQLTVNNFHQSGLNKFELSWLGAKEYAFKIASSGQRRTYQFNRDVVAAPIVGKSFRDTPTQLKWEGIKSRDFLNSTNVPKKVITL